MARMPLDRVIVTCAATGNLTALAQAPHLPVTPEQVADACPGAAEAGAAVAHSHVREPGTGKPPMELGLHQDVVERIRRRDTDLILNVTTGPGGRHVPSGDDPAAGAGTTLMHPEKRVAHIAAVRSETCALGPNAMNPGGRVVTNAPGNVRRMARVIREAGVKPEIELPDSGDIALMHDLVAGGSTGPPLCSFVAGVRCGSQPSPGTVPCARGLLPPDSPFTAIGTGKAAFTMAAQPFLAGGHVRVGLEDSMHLGKGVLAPSDAAAMVTKVRGIVGALGGQVANPAEARAA